MDQYAEWRAGDNPGSPGFNSGSTGISARRHGREARAEHVERMLRHLRLHGEQRDIEIARALDLPLELVRSEIEALAANGDVTTCRVIRFEESRKTEGVSCRLAGTVPITKPVASPWSLDREAGVK